MKLDPVQSIIVTGARSSVGRYLLNHCDQKKIEVQAISRNTIISHTAEWINMDIKSISDWGRVKNADTLIHLAPVWLLPQLIPTLKEKGIQQIIAFSSTSRFTKSHSKNLHEQNIAQQLMQAELSIAEQCNQHQIAWTVVRPTLIYDNKQQNDSWDLGKGLNTILKFIQTYHFFPLIGKAAGNRQPVHADDLAKACIQLLRRENSYSQSYNLSGGEELSYRAMIERIFLHIQQQPHFIQVPRSVINGMICALKLIPRYRFLTTQMLDRMSMDMNFDHRAAQDDFGFTPRRFLKT